MLSPLTLLPRSISPGSDTLKPSLPLLSTCQYGLLRATSFEQLILALPTVLHRPIAAGPGKLQPGTLLISTYQDGLLPALFFGQPMPSLVGLQHRSTGHVSSTSKRGQLVI